jgi:hypothetical protein
MSKAVKKVTRSVKKVVSGINKMQKKIRKSKAFKVIAIAAAVYFGGAALVGAIKGGAAASAAGTSVMAGAGQGALGGIGSAGAGISNAWTNLTQMQFKAAGNSLVGGVTNAGTAGANAVTSGAGWSGAMKSGFTHTTTLFHSHTGRHWQLQLGRKLWQRRFRRRSKRYSDSRERGAGIR